VLTWIVNKISRTILKAGFVTIAFLVTGKFVISALVMLLLVCLTDVTHIALATDRVQPSQKPETWNIGPLVRVAAVLGVLTLIEALGLLAIGWRRFGLFGDPGLRRRRALAVSACPKRVHLRLRHNLFARPERSRQVVSLRPCPPRSAPTAGRSEKKKGPPRLVGAAAMSNKTGSSTAKGIEA
jgi:hypothetical protein